MDDELRGQLRELTGDRLGVCDICGRTVAQFRVVSVDGGEAVAEATEPLRVCDVCFIQIERGEIRLPGSAASLDDDAP